MKNSIFLVIAFIIIAGLAFAFGLRYRFISPRFNNYNNRVGYQRPFMMRGQNWGVNGMMGYGRLSGQITKIDGNNVTVQLINGQTYALILNSGMTINKVVKGSSVDLKTGQNIMISGNVNGLPQTIWINQ